jgi:hypothetical protein
VASRLDDMIFKLAQYAKLLIQRTYCFWISECVAAPKAAAFNRGVKRRAKNNVMKRLRQPSEAIDEPRPDYPIDNDEVVSLRIFVSCLRKHIHNHFVLLVRSEAGKVELLPS